MQAEWWWSIDIDGFVDQSVDSILHPPRSKSNILHPYSTYLFNIFLLNIKLLASGKQIK